MSSKQAKKLLRQKEEKERARQLEEQRKEEEERKKKSEAGEEDEEESEEEVIPVKKSAFAMMMGSSSDEESDSEEEKQSADEESKPETPVYSPKKGDKNDKKNAKSGKVGKNKKADEEDSDEEEQDDTDDWKALEEAEKHMQNEEDPADEVNPLQTKDVPPMERLLRIKKENFSPEAEFKRIFGDTKKTGPKKKKAPIALPLHLRKQWLVLMQLEEVGDKRPDMASCGTCVMQETSKDIFDYTIAPDSQKASQVEEDWYRILNAHDPYLLEVFTRELPFHCDANVLLAESMRMRENHEIAMTLTKRGLFAMECNFLGTFRPFGSFISGGGTCGGASSSSATPNDDPSISAAGGNEEKTATWLNKNYVSRPQSLAARGMQILGRGMFLYMMCLQSQGLFTTALEVAKLIWKLSYYGGENSLFTNSKKRDVVKDKTNLRALRDDTEKAEEVDYSGFDPCHMLIHVLYLGIRARRYDFVDTICGIDLNTRQSNLSYYDADKFKCKSAFDKKEAQPDLPQWDGETYSKKQVERKETETSSKDRDEEQGSEFHKSMPCMASLYPPMAYTMALSAFYQASDVKQLKNEVLSVTDIVNWKCPGKSATEKLVKAIFLYPYLLKILLEKNEIKLDSKPPGQRIANKTWMDLLNQLQEFGFQPEPFGGLSNLESSYTERFYLLWKSDTILAWIHDSLCRLTKTFEDSSLFKGDWKKGIDEFSDYLKEHHVTLYGCYYGMSLAEFTDVSASMIVPSIMQDKELKNRAENNTLDDLQRMARRNPRVLDGFREMINREFASRPDLQGSLQALHDRLQEQLRNLPVEQAAQHQEQVRNLQDPLDQLLSSVSQEEREAAMRLAIGLDSHGVFPDPATNGNVAVDTVESAGEGGVHPQAVEAVRLSSASEIPLPDIAALETEIARLPRRETAETQEEHRILQEMEDDLDEQVALEQAIRNSLNDMTVEDHDEINS